ncbi:uncharacterized protein [Miscanthus floridulus]|uniref:uncharacterized protein n=1 Tax=Miscanthus floridulus TaxID=154761 RepID=UPI00345853B4
MTQTDREKSFEADSSCTHADGGGVSAGEGASSGLRGSGGGHPARPCAPADRATLASGVASPGAAVGPAQGRCSPAVAGPTLAQAEAVAASRSSAGVVPALAQACSARRSQAAHAQVAGAPVHAQAAGPAARVEAAGRAAGPEAAGAFTCAQAAGPSVRAQPAERAARVEAAGPAARHQAASRQRGQLLGTKRRVLPMVQATPVRALQQPSPMVQLSMNRK